MKDSINPVNMKNFLIGSAFGTLVTLSFNTVFAFAGFSDVNSNDWFADSVEELSQIGVIEGYPDGTFKPSNNANRAEIAEMLSRLLEYVETGEVSIEEFNPLARVVSGLPTRMMLDVPFTSQAPGGNWSPPYDEACEEASLIMVDYFLRGKTLDAATADSEIRKLTSWVASHGYGVDVGAQESAEIMLNYFFRQSKVYTGDQVSIQNIKGLLNFGYPVIVPVQGQDLGNPNFTSGGPPYHMIVIVGYDETYFYAHDPGTRNGEAYPYKIETLYNAIHDWTGSKSTVRNGERAMMVLK